MVEEVTTLETLRRILEYIAGFLSLSDIPDNGYYRGTIGGMCKELETLRPVDEDNPPRPNARFCPYMSEVGTHSTHLRCNVLERNTNTPEVCKPPLGDVMEPKWKNCPAYKERKAEEDKVDRKHLRNIFIGEDKVYGSHKPPNEPAFSTINGKRITTADNIDSEQCEMCGNPVEKTVKLMTLYGSRWMCPVCKKDSSDIIIVRRGETKK